MSPNELLKLLQGLENVNSKEDMAEFLKEYNKKQQQKEEEKEKEDKKFVEYSRKLSKAVLSILLDKENPNHIDINELSQSDNGDQFVHALVNVMPAVVLDTITDEDRDDEDSIDRHTNYLRLIIKYAEPSGK